jgi:hypothetical protein
MNHEIHHLVEILWRENTDLMDSRLNEISQEIYLMNKLRKKGHCKTTNCCLRDARFYLVIRGQTGKWTTAPNKCEAKKSWYVAVFLTILDSCLLWQVSTSKVLIIIKSKRMRPGLKWHNALYNDGLLCERCCKPSSLLHQSVTYLLSY